ncbi:MAG: hypothetical protein ACOYNS_04445 [Bacteroidota bacterium]
MKIIRNIVIGIILFSVSPMMLSAQPSTFVSVGCKIGYSVGATSEMIGGVEISVTQFPEFSRPAMGACLSYEFSKSKKLVHAGVEFISAIPSGSIGPTVMFSNERTEYGISGTLWTAVVIMPYLRQTVMFGDAKNASEIGLFLKIPKKLSGPAIRFGG